MDQGSSNSNIFKFICVLEIFFITSLINLGEEISLNIT
jgi:hypothetical protein